MRLAMTLAVLIPFSAVASGTDTKKMIEKVEARLRTIHQQDRKATTPIASAQHQSFWSSVSKAYDFLKAHDFSERYFFMYEAIRGFTMDSKDRSIHLQSWIERENKKILERIISPTVKTNWNSHVVSIRRQIDGLQATHIPTKAYSPREEIEFLRNLNADLHLAIINTPAKSKVQTAPAVTAPVVVKEVSGHSNIILIASVFAAFLAGLTTVLFRKKDTVEAVESVPETPMEMHIAEEIHEDVVEMEETIVVTHAPIINLEEECRKFLSANAHLIQNADLQLTPVAKSPFKTAVSVSPEKIHEALEFFLKGTMSVVNLSRSKASGIEWSCSESDGRVYLEFTLHGVQCDDRNLYFNTLIDGTGSAPAYFGRTEAILEDHLASIQLESNTKRTSIALGLDASKNITSYC